MNLQIKNRKLFINDKEVKSIMTISGDKIEKQFYYSATYDGYSKELIVDGYNISSYRTIDDEKTIVSQLTTRPQKNITQIHTGSGDNVGEKNYI